MLDWRRQASKIQCGRSSNELIIMGTQSTTYKNGTERTSPTTDIQDTPLIRFGKVLRTFRETKNYSLIDISEATKIDIELLNKIESGTATSYEVIKYLSSISKALRIDPKTSLRILFDLVL
ncbi:MAG: helix-turn-helix domain-containing protein [Bacteroidales bacterium]|nr:helix-turn-helix domain-containing protein [Bacteroidales bacterium]